MAPASSPLVVVVDDDEAVRDAFRSVLESAGYTVECYDSATALFRTDALVRARCLLVDLRMPRTHGLRLLTTIRQRGLRVPIIVVTGHGSVPVTVSAMRAACSLG